MAGHAVEAVEVFHGLLREMLDKARASKQTDAIEPPLARADLTQLLQRVESIEHFSTPLEANKSFRYAVIETSIRSVFNDLLASSKINSPDFVNIWDLLDIVSILSDDELCDPALGFWLVEELLDSQTIAGCRKVFDYLESRRERMTAKHFKQKELVILRSCKELLRRLSRAEDTAFCGRVYVFMFQSFPLGDKSSVNLRGEYHVENVTTFDGLPKKIESSDPMEVDSETKATAPALETDTKATPGAPAGLAKSNEDSKNATKSVTFDAKESSKDENPLDPDALYPIFWSLQQSFSQPKRLFDQSNLSEFKRGLEATIVMFKSVQNEQSGRNVDEGKRGTKRKRGQRGDDLATTFNPKYLTSRDLFELEISDLSFRRHILVQALIIMDFLVSLSPKAKEKLTNIKAQNKSVMYQEQVLSEEDTKWALDTKKTIAEYLRQGFEGPFFYRMVETVLSRDKNWVRWKIESCPPIERPAISPEEHIAAKTAARKATTNRRLRAKPLGSLDLGFLSEADGAKGMEKLKDPSRYTLPSLSSFKDKIALDDLEIQMPTSQETKEDAINSKASKSWRALRIASKTKLAAFDKIQENLQNFDVIFQDDEPELDAVKDEGQDDGEEVTFPDDRRPVIISGPSGVGKGTLMKMLIDKHPKIFAKRVSHTTRAPSEGEIDGWHYHFVDMNKFNIMRDGDQFLEYATDDGHEYGTTRKAVESVIAAGKIPIMEMSCQRAQQVKDMNYSARFIFLTAPTMEELERRLRMNDAISEEKVQARLKSAKEDLKQSEIEEFYEKVVINDDLTSTVNELEQILLGKAIGDGLPATSGEEPVATTEEVEEMDGVTVKAEGITAPDAVDVPMT